MTDYVPPRYRAKAFHCPHADCRAFAHQEWARLATCTDFIERISISVCSKCKKYAVWVDKKIVYPDASRAPLPVEDMPDDIKRDFEEARIIFNTSPRAAAALMRLALEKLLIYLDAKNAEGDNLNKMIRNLVERGLPRKIQRACDVVRFIGNNSVHPGKIDVEDNEDIALALFGLLNIIVEDMIAGSESRKIDEMYENYLPEHIRESIQRRDRRG